MSAIDGLSADVALQAFLAWLENMRAEMIVSLKLFEHGIMDAICIVWYTVSVGLVHELQKASAVLT